LHIKHLRNLLVSISAFTVLAVMFLANSENVYSQCTPGFNGPHTTTIHPGPGCRVEIDYCLSLPSPASGLCNIHITKQRYFGECSNYLGVDQYGNSWLSMGEIVTHITRLPENFPCFDLILIPPCGEPMSYPVVLVSNGGCYSFNDYFTPEGEWVRECTPCDINGISYCYQYYSFCKEFINNKWKIKAIAGPPVEQFECIDPNCSPYCF
jgi:hypothetical protein